MTRTITRPWDYLKHFPLNETEKEVEALPSEWRMRYREIFFGAHATLSQHQALLQVQSEMAMQCDECPCFLPEQTCAADRHLEALYDDKTDVELPY